jgi:hypothetical protein
MPLNFNEGAYGQTFQQGQQNLQRPDFAESVMNPIASGLSSLVQAKSLEAERKQKNDLYQLQLAEAQRKAQEAGVEGQNLFQLLSGNALSQPVSSFDMVEQVTPPTPMPSFGGPQVNQSMMGLPPQQQMANQGVKPNFIEQFRNFQGGGKLRPTRMDIGEATQVQGPSYPVAGPQPMPNIGPQLANLGLPLEAGSWNLGQAKKFGESKKLFSDMKKDKEPGSFEAVLADKYNKGEITLDQWMEMKKSMAPEGTFMMGGLDATGKPIFYGTKDPTKTVVGQVPGGGMLQPKTPSEGQMNAGLFGTRAAEANQQFENLLQKGIDPTSISEGGQSFLPNIAQSEGIQSIEQAKRNFMAAVLRKESGMMISQQEMESGNKQYFDQIGDKPNVREQKRINRETAIRGLKAMAGPMLGAMQGQQTPGGLTWQGRPIKDTPANRAWLAQQQGVQQ